MNMNTSPVSDSALDPIYPLLTTSRTRPFHVKLLKTSLICQDWQQLTTANHSVHSESSQPQADPPKQHHHQQQQQSSQHSALPPVRIAAKHRVNATHHVTLHAWNKTVGKMTANGVTSTPQSTTPTHLDDPISLWLKHGDLDKLEQAVLDGYADHLTGRSSHIPHVNRFLKTIPALQARIEEIHRSVILGKGATLRKLLDKKKFAFSRDQMGATPLHKAIVYGKSEMIHFLLDQFPNVIHARDHVSTHW